MRDAYEVDEDARRDAIDGRHARKGGCGGLGYIPVRGEPNAADPCDCPACNPHYGEDE